MNLYLISQTVNNTWDTYIAAVVCAPDEETARSLNPDTGKPMTDADWRNGLHDAWVSSPSDVQVRYLGPADPSVKPGLVLASFNAS